MKMFIFATLVVAIFLGGAEGVRVYSSFETNDERFFGMVVLVMPIVLFMAIASLHGLMFGQRVKSPR